MAELERIIEIGIDARKAKQGAREVDQSMSKVKGSTKLARNELGQFEKRADLAGKAAKALGGAVLALAGGFTALAVIRTSLSDLVAYDRALIGLGKTADLAGNQLTGIGDEVIRLARTLPGTSEELINTAAAAARLGVASEDLLDFTATIARFGSATGGLIAGDEAATQLARIINVTAEGAQKVEELAGAIALLGDSIAADEAEITRFTTQVAQATTIFDIGSINATAFAGTLAALGVRAELSGSSIGRTFRAVDSAIRDGGEALDLLALITQRSRDSFEPLQGRGGVRTVTEFLQGLGDFINSGGDASKILQEFGLSGEEVLKVIPTLALNADQLARNLQLVESPTRSVNKLFEETERGTTQLDQRFERLSDTIAEIRLQYSRKFQDEIKGTTTALSEAAAVAFELDGAQEEASKSSELLGEGLQTVGLALGVGTGVGIAASLPGVIAQLDKLRKALLGITGLSAGAAVGAKVALGAFVAISSFKLGEKLFNEVDGVQQFGNKLAAAFQIIESDIIFYWDRLLIELKEAFDGFLGDITFAVADAAINNTIVGSILPDRVLNPARTIVAAGRAASGVDLFDRNAAIAEAQSRRAAREELAGLGFIGAESQRIEQFGEDAGEGWLEGFNREVLANKEETAQVINEVVGAVDNVVQGSEAALDVIDERTPVSAENIEKINDALAGSAKEASSARSAVAQYVEQLAIESSLLGEGETVRQQSIELQRLRAQLLKEEGDELERIQRLLDEGPIDVEVDPEKLQRVNTILDGVKDRLEDLRNAQQFEGFANSAGDEFGDFAKRIIFELESVEDAAEALVKNISALVFEQLVSRQIANAISGAVLQFGSPAAVAANGAIVNSGAITAFASGGVVDRPTLFGMTGNRVGLMGEAGPEAIVPLPDGRSIPVAMAGGGGTTNNTVKINVSTPNADSFLESESQILKGAKRQLQRIR